MFDGRTRGIPCLVRSHETYSITSSGTPAPCFVINQNEHGTLGDLDMSEILVTVLSFYDIDFKKESQMTAGLLREQYKGFCENLQFGSKTARAYRDLVAEAASLACA